jgi:hypothetical protein
MAESRSSLRSIRFIIYLTTVFYGFVNIASQDQPLAEVAAAPKAILISASVVGTIQLLAALLGAMLELSKAKGTDRARQWIFLALSLSFLYEFALVALLSGNPFMWAPLLVYSVICSVIYLAEG